MGKKKILVVEDEYSINDAVTFALRKEGYDVRSVFKGRDALEKVREFEPNLVLLDLMLPDIDGFDVCKEISKSTYVIMLTARGEIIDRILGLELGADDYIVKPFEIKEVLVRIKVIFRRNEKRLVENNFLDGDKKNEIIQINTKERSVIKDGEGVILRRKEFDLLNFLYENKGIVFSRNDLLDKVWGYDYEGDTRTVDVHIRRLREKLNEDKDNSIIETVFGIGYIMR
ncbi:MULTISPECIES: response regulator transcription factor [Clostridium]|uniref:response regulator transcription factor n=1 Tax=Clostridium TaxID=1485 RepID=UPI001899B7D9|nr:MULTISPECIES: response regulator transcription factor [Clostridium]MCR1952612.1 response regulator transcription factor [Clostridium sp. DSM 100503]MDI9215403.1 response regulator transcription factor [Clostridium tertium]